MLKMSQVSSLVSWNGLTRCKSFGSGTLHSGLRRKKSRICGFERPNFARPLGLDSPQRE
jgi:hypothetical protein